MSPAQTRSFTILVITLVLLNACITGQQRPPFRTKGEKIDENIPDPNEQDIETFEGHKVPGGHVPKDPGDQKVDGKVVAPRALDEDVTIDNLLRDRPGPAVRVTKGKSSYVPKTYLMDLDLMAQDHPAKRLRAGSATSKDTCKRVRNVPTSLRNSNVMYAPINNFYTKYTEVYGIPIIGSKHVTNEGLMRACYTTKVMLASNYNIRNAFYKNFGRVALIADNEQQTSLYEYRTWDPAYWNARVRGLGPSTTIPLASAGDDNQRCKAGDRYFDQDILAHELGHGVHTLAARYVIPGFQQRLTAAYERNVINKKKWAGTYAAKNDHEYFAVGTQFYFNSFRGSAYAKYTVFNQKSLRKYDSDLASLLDDVYSCFQKSRKRYIHRCRWKNCNLKNFKLKYGPIFRAKANCEALKESNKMDDPAKCAKFTCYHLGNAFNWRGSECIALKCKYNNKGEMDFVISQNLGYSIGFSIYYTDNIPKMRVPASCNVQPAQRKTLKTITDEAACSAIGGCYEKRTCYYPTQECTNRLTYCSDLSMRNECTRNWPFMYRTCATACNKCASLLKYKPDEINSLCQDKSEYCQDWEKTGECSRNPPYMKRNCAASCKECKVPRAKY